MTTEAGIALIVTSIGIFSVFIGLFVWGLVTGQFRNVEEAKYLVLEPEDFDDINEGDEKDGSAA